MINDSNYKDKKVECYAGTGDEETEQNKPSFGIKILVFITIIAVIVSLGYVGIKNVYPHENRHESVSNHKTDQDIREAKRNKRIDEGYQKIYETFLKADGDQYKKDYNAKGNSYIIICEDETQIRYLMYDRDDDHGTKAQYVYFQNKKDPDGSWSPMNSEILDMYQYDYESKEVNDLEKNGW